jgi:hemerythrin-like domain-containing protein
MKPFSIGELPIQKRKEKFMASSSRTRRNFLCSSIAGAAFVVPGVLLTGQASKRDDEKRKDEEKEGEEISPAEDLMREHGVLNRILLIYDHHLHLISAKRTFDGSVLADSADIVRRFVEEYHEKLEEDYLFPRFRKAKKLVGLVDTLQAQHKRGRELTAQIRELGATASLKYVSSVSDKLADALRAFLRMYRPHEAREDTVLFPAFRTIVSNHEHDALGDDFEKKEDQLFGEEGFFKVVDQVAALERRLGIYDLAQFTPK